MAAADTGGMMMVMAMTTITAETGLLRFVVRPRVIGDYWLLMADGRRPDDTHTDSAVSASKSNEAAPAEEVEVVARARSCNCRAAGD